MSIRLSQQKRKEIREAATRKKFQKALDEVEDDLRSLCNSFQCKMYHEETQKWLDDAPEGGVPQNSQISVYSEKDQHLGIFSVDSFRVLYEELYSSPKYKASASEEKKIKKLLKRQNDLRKHRSDFKTLIGRALESCNTVKQLQEHYPDIAKYLPNTAQSSGQLAVRSEDIAAAFEEPVPRLEKEKK